MRALRITSEDFSKSSPSLPAASLYARAAFRRSPFSRRIAARTTCNSGDAFACCLYHSSRAGTPMLYSTTKSVTVRTVFIVTPFCQDRLPSDLTAASTLVFGRPICKSMDDLFNWRETIRASNKRLSRVVRLALPTDSRRLLIRVSRTTPSPSTDKALLTSFKDRRPSESSFS